MNITLTILISCIISVCISSISCYFIYDFFHVNYKRRFARDFFYARGYRKVRLLFKNRRREITFVAYYDYAKLIDSERRSRLNYFIGSDYNFDTDQFIEKRFFVNEIDEVEDITGQEFSYIIKVDDPDLF